MPFKKESTEADFMRRVEALRQQQQVEHHRANHRDYWSHGIIATAMVLVAISNLLTGQMLLALYATTVAIWVGISLMLNLTINRQRYLIGMMSGLHDLENQELKRITSQQPVRPHSVKTAKAVI